MDKFKRMCANCGKEYEVILGNVDINSYRNICCTPECYFELEERKNAVVEIPVEEDNKIEVAEGIFIEEAVVTEESQDKKTTDDTKKKKKK